MKQNRTCKILSQSLGGRSSADPSAAAVVEAAGDPEEELARPTAAEGSAGRGQRRRLDRHGSAAVGYRRWPGHPAGQTEREKYDRGRDEGAAGQTTAQGKQKG